MRVSVSLFEQEDWISYNTFLVYMIFKILWILCLFGYENERVGKVLAVGMSVCLFVGCCYHTLLIKFLQWTYYNDIPGIKENNISISRLSVYQV